MTDDEIRIAIAESVGWSWDHWGKAQVRIQAPAGYRSPQWICSNPDNAQILPSKGTLEESKLYWCGGLPDYPNDLNAIHEVEKALGADHQYTYGEVVREISKNVGPKGGHFVPNGFGCFAMAHLTAAQRCEAYLRTIGKWK